MTPSPAKASAAPRRSSPRSLPQQGFIAMMLGLGLGVAVLLIAFHAYLRHAETDVTAVRLNGVAGEARQILEERMNLGLPLNYLAEAQALIERLKTQSGGVAAVSVYGESKEVLYATERAWVGGAAPREWLGENGGLRWRTAVIYEDGALTVIAPIIDGANRPAGGVVVRAAQASAEARTVEAMSLALALALGFLAVAAVIAWIACRLLLAEPERALEQACDVLIELRRADVERRPARLTANAAPPDAAPAAASAGAALRALSGGRDATRRIEETA